MSVPIGVAAAGKMRVDVANRVRKAERRGMPILGSISDDLRHRAADNLPGIRPLGWADWITVDTSYAEQIAEKQRLLSECSDAVYQLHPAAKDAATELLSEVLALLRMRRDFDVSSDTVRCPDGRVVQLMGPPPLLFLSQLIQEDVCLHLKSGTVHCLLGALLCFPASWTLSQKIGKPLIAVHAPVPEYDADLARRVQRLFDGVQVGQPIWRANLLRYDDPALYQPRTEDNPRPVGSAMSGFERSERQTLFRLPKTRAVVFAIHTTVAKVTAETPPAYAR